MTKEGKTTVVPKMRFPEFRARQDWESTQLCNASVPVSERVGERKLTPVSISAGIGFVPQTEKFGRDISGNQYSLYTLVRDGDFVFNKGNSLKFPQGCVYQLRGWGEVAAPNVFISFRLKQGVVAEYFQYCFEKNIHGVQLKKHITSGARSNGLLNVSKDQFYGISIPTPLPDEQQKIADCLTSLDEVIAAQGRKVDALKTYKRGLVQQLFPREGETRPRFRFPEFASASAWHSQKIASLLSKASFAVSVEPEKMYREIGIRSHGKGIFHKEPIRGTVIGEKRVFHVVQDALVLNIVFAWEQAVATTSEKEVGMIASHRFPMYVAKPGKCDVEYVKGFFLTNEGKRLLGVASPGGAGRNKTLGQKEFENLEIALPVSVDEQTRIANCISSFDTKITIESNKLESLKTHKRGLMQQLLPSPVEA
jgi:type I restriction enzyme S subunit